MNKQGIVTEMQPEYVWSALSSEEKTDLYKRWKQLGWSQGRFCKKQGLPLDTLYTPNHIVLMNRVIGGIIGGIHSKKS